MPRTGAPVRLLCVARLAPVKGHRYLLRALARLREAGLECELTLAGDGPERDALERQAAELGLADAVRFLGFQRQTEIRTLYRWCDLMVLPSLSEGIPISLMEAMACGRPVVATTVRGVPQSRRF